MKKLLLCSLLILSAVTGLRAMDGESTTDETDWPDSDYEQEE